MGSAHSKPRSSKSRPPPSVPKRRVDRGTTKPPKPSQMTKLKHHQPSAPAPQRVNPRAQQFNPTPKLVPKQPIPHGFAQPKPVKAGDIKRKPLPPGARVPQKAVAAPVKAPKPRKQVKFDSAAPAIISKAPPSRPQFQQVPQQHLPQKAEMVWGPPPKKPVRHPWQDEELRANGPARLKRPTVPESAHDVRWRQHMAHLRAEEEWKEKANREQERRRRECMQECDQRTN